MTVRSDLPALSIVCLTQTEKHGSYIRKEGLGSDEGEWLTLKGTSTSISANDPWTHMGLVQAAIEQRMSLFKIYIRLTSENARKTKQS
jgi:hypothetical protein